MSLDDNDELKNKINKILKNTYLIICRLILVIFLFIVVVFIGLKIPEKLKNMDFSWTSLEGEMIYGGPILGGAIILATLKFLGEKVSVLWDYILHNRREKIIDFYSAVFVAVLGYSIANLSIKEIVPPKYKDINQPSVFLNFNTPSAYLATANGSDLPVFFITFPETSSSLKVTDAQLLLLENLVGTLSECSKLGGAGRQNLKIKTIGFASSSGTNIENKKLADQRADWVKSYLEKLFNESAFQKEKMTIISHVWETFNEMRTKRIFVDENMFENSKEGYSEQAAALNRRVEIHLLDVGGCQA